MSHKALSGGLVGWLLVFLAWIVVYTLFCSPGSATASTLGWTATITTVANEVRNIGLVCIGLAIVLTGIIILFHRRMENLGSDLSGN